ncbi:serine phosphatase RsbU (regulator of sigma subunit) [Thermonema lapsum]|uniref:Serine phosphatase RsbU (Regulator of sigma subunit) n=1 Tax=Thermonema lapsum TaxID=28195 RepID=A0A846MQJ7_9BACT|nr:7TM diverse intracellular signaling domain-containing protein [Thermonema lapsum]NIK73547.1 serine phosphatase RsbU (regulator of sigma subunit) [Thermonema lapsum]
MRFALFSVFCPFFFLLSYACVQAQPTQWRVVPVGKEQLSVSLTEYAFYLEDPTAALSIRQVASPAYADKFRPIGSKNFNAGYTASRYWLRLSIENTTNESQKYYLEQAYPLIDTVALYEIDETGNITERLGGDMLPKHLTEVDFRHPVFHLQLAPSERKILYLSFRTEGTMSVSLRLWQPDAFRDYVSDSQLGFGIYYGIMLVMLLYNLFIFFFLKDKVYLLYVFNIFALMFFQAEYTGFAYQYFWGEFPWLNHRLFPASIAVLAGAGTAFAYRFLGVEQLSEHLKKLFWFLLAVAALEFCLAWLLPHTLSNRVNAASSILMVLVLIGVGTYALQRGVAVAHFFLLAWGFYLLGALMTLLRAFGWLPTNFITFYSIQIGSALEVILLALGLAYRIDLLRREVVEKEKQARRAEEEKARLIQEQNLRLEELVEERTQALELTNRRLTDSIRYAKRIQDAILPHKEAIFKCFHDAFIFFQPRDIVSGDFYWFAETEDKVLVAAVDCTGHGVPGAFMSLIGNTLLNEIVYERGITRPSEILRELHKEIRTALKQEEGTGSDGMDLALCSFHKDLQVIEFAGAYNPLWYVADGELFEVKADNMPVGGIRRGVDRYFTNHLIDISRYEHVECFLFSDGFVDQFGGPRRRKYMLNRFRETILRCYTEFVSAKSQHLFLHKEFEDWRGNESQIDDVLVIGLQVKWQGKYALKKE